MKIVIATLKSWNIEHAEKLKAELEPGHEVLIMSSKDELSVENIEKIKPDFIFFPHWSYIIPADIYDKYNCVVFHMTDLPYGRGGSPLQNLIVRGHKDTKISAIKVTAGIDEGPVYFKENLSLDGSADEIFRRLSDVVFNKMIPRFLSEDLKPIPQEGEPVVFKRRKPWESELTPEMTLSTVYDYIRMLDAEGYPSAFCNYGDKRMEFKAAEYGTDENGEYVRATVIFRRKENE